MQVATNKIVTINYTLTDENGAVLDQSHDGNFAYLHGTGNIIPGLEKALDGKAVGEKIEVEIPPAEAYGERNPDLTEVVPKHLFQGVETVEPGMQFQARNQEGQTVMLNVLKVEGDEVHVDANHPLAGVTLNFNVDVLEVRDATEQELQHGHAHGAHGHDH